MPRLPDADSLGARPVAQPVGQILTYDTTAEGRAVARFGQAANEVAVRELERRDKLAYAGAKSALIQKDMEIRQALENDPDYETYGTRYEEQFSKAREEVQNKLGANFYRDTFGIEAEQIGTSGKLNVADMRQRRETDHGIATLNTLIETNRSAALAARDEATKASLIDATNAAIDGAMARGYLTETKAGEVRRGFVESYAEGSLDLLTPGERVRALQNVKEGSPLSFVQPDRRAKLLEAAKSEVERQGAIYRARVSDDFQNTLAYLNAGGDPSRVSSNRQELVSAFGAERGAAYADQLERSITFASDLRDLSSASPDEVNGTLEALKPTGPEDYKEKAGRYNTYVSALAARNKALATDPVSYIARNAPDVSAAIQQVSSGGSWDEVVAPLDASYDQLGVPRRNRHVLPADSAKNLVAEIMAEDGSNISANLDSLRASMSASTWSRVYGDLVTLGDLPSGAQVVVEISPANSTAKDAMGQALKLGSKELDNLVIADDKKTIEEEVPTALEEFRKSLVGSAAGNAAYLARERAVTDLAKTYLANGTVTNASDAVTKAATDIVNWAYDFSSSGWRVPKDASGESRLGDVEYAAEQAVQAIVPSDLAVMPADEELVRVLGKDEVQRQYAAQPKVWRNTANDEGLQLFYANSGLPVFDAKGAPILLNFDEVQPGTRPREDGIFPTNDMLNAIAPVRGIFPEAQ